ncbi:hypothetical protein G4H71_05230 [Rhodococcus triatomae]|nr:hypothetical protein G4H72_02815 [Rhodococcus triatomae]QNG25552.1 hypothetical protein G4H71_05230 [Rhodococcus triatomae]
MPEPTPAPHSADTDPEEKSRARIDRARLARVFGDVLPETTSDERGNDREAGDGDDWLRRQVPPHHG